jgi:hypothetical protein
MKQQKNDLHVECLLHHHGIPAREMMPIIGDVSEAFQGGVWIHWNVKERQSTKRGLSGISLCSCVFRACVRRMGN